MELGWRLGLGLLAGLALAWLALVAVLLALRPDRATLAEAVRVLPDTVRLVRRLAADCELPGSLRLRLWLLLAYLAVPIDLVPDAIPVLGYADDAIVLLAVVRSVLRRAGPAALRRHWPGTDQGLAALLRLAGLPGG